MTDSIDGFRFSRFESTSPNQKDQDVVRCCFDCDFFQIDGKEVSEMNEGDWADGCAEGECRFNPPVLGPEIERNGESIRLYGEFPKVLVTDWCGQFRPRAT